MKILLVGNYPPDEQESMRRYTAWLATQLRRRGHEVSVIAPAPFFGRMAFVPPTLRKWLGYLDKFLLFPRRLRRSARAADLVHICDHSNSMYLRFVRSKPNVITCHDLLAIRSALGHFPENRVAGAGRLLQRIIARGLRRAKSILCISENTREDLQRFLHLPAERLHAIPLPLNWPFRPAAPAEQDAARMALGIPPGRPYFLHVGANHWYKNRFAVLPIFKALREHEPYRDAALVLAGQPWPREFHEYLAEHGLADSAKGVFNASNEHLQALYTGATALIFPSRYEGFGWPILEAQACGCPVATVDRAPMNAVAGGAAIYIDPADPVAAAETIARGLRDAQALREAGFRNLALFHTHDIIDAYLTAYRQQLGESGAARG